MPGGEGEHSSGHIQLYGGQKGGNIVIKVEATLAGAVTMEL